MKGIGPRGKAGLPCGVADCAGDCRHRACSVFSVYWSVTKSSTSNEVTAEVLQNLRTSVVILEQDLRMAGSTVSARPAQASNRRLPRAFDSQLTAT